MKILITPDTNIIPASDTGARMWKVDRIVVLNSSLDSILNGLPSNHFKLTFFVPTILDPSNPISYTGANLALRILFKYIRETNQGVNIVLYGVESKEAFLMHYDIPNILKIPGIYYCIFNKETISNYDNESTIDLSRENYRHSLEYLDIKMPHSFRYTHSLTNEWCLYKWNSFMEFDSQYNRDNLQLLYFDYIKTIERLNSVKSKNAKNSLKLLNEISLLKDKDARVLLVDDNPGWYRFFCDFFKDSKIEFKAIGRDYRKMKLDDIIQSIEAEVDSFSPDVILLDFRLIEDRDANCDFKEISGTRVLKKLKGTFDSPGKSFGRQILVFTATSRIENILRLKGLNADGFILKEKTDYYSSKIITKDLISSMVKDLMRAIVRAKFLIPLNEELINLTNLDIMSDSVISPTLRNYIGIVVSSVRLALQNNELNDGVLKLVYLNLFTILEYIKPSKACRINDFIQSFAPDDIQKYWNNIDGLRNALAHGDNSVRIDNKKVSISDDLVQHWVLALSVFIRNFIERHK